MPRTRGEIRRARRQSRRLARDRSGWAIDVLGAAALVAEARATSEGGVMDRYDASMVVEHLREVLYTAIDGLREARTDRPTLPLNAAEWEIIRTSTPNPPGDGYWLIDVATTSLLDTSGDYPIVDQRSVYHWARKRKETK
jgi:hypothetical protein